MDSERGKGIHIADHIGRFDARFHRGGEGGHRAALGEPHHADALRVHFRPGAQIVHAALHVPDIQRQRVQSHDSALEKVDIAGIASERVVAVPPLSETAQIGCQRQKAGARHLRRIVIIHQIDVGLMFGR